MTSTATAATAAIDATATQAFIQRWQHNTASELATAQSFVMQNQREQANEYLANFAKLLRLVMENSALPPM